MHTSCFFKLSSYIWFISCSPNCTVFRDVIIRWDLFPGLFVPAWSCQGKIFTSPRKGGNPVTFFFFLITTRYFINVVCLWRMLMHRHYWAVSFVQASSWLTVTPEEVIRKISWNTNLQHSGLPWEGIAMTKGNKGTCSQEQGHCPPFFTLTGSSR